MKEKFTKAELEIISLDEECIVTSLCYTNECEIEGTGCVDHSYCGTVADCKFEG